MRIFISIELPDEIKKNLDKLMAKLKETEAAVKWVKAENLHITLKFLGWVEVKQLDNLIKLTREAISGFESFKISFENLGTFPPGENPKIIWVGTDKGGHKLCKLAKNLEETLAAFGYKKESREFKSHITIGRVKGKQGADKLKAKIKSLKAPKFGAVLVDRISIMKSTLTPKGPIYEKVKELSIA